MTDYKRMVSYMYQYENGVKKKNVGYVRIEVRNGQCKFTLHMQLLGQLDSIFPTYLIRREDESIELIYLGDTILRNQMMDSKLTADENNIMESGHKLSEMAGLLLFLHDNIFFATEWEDKPIIASEVLEALKPKNKTERNEEPMEETPEADISAASVQNETQVPGQVQEEEASVEVLSPEGFRLSEEINMPKYKLPRGWKTIECRGFLPATDALREEEQSLSVADLTRKEDKSLSVAGLTYEEEQSQVAADLRLEEVGCQPEAGNFPQEEQSLSVAKVSLKEEIQVTAADINIPAANLDQSRDNIDELPEDEQPVPDEGADEYNSDLPNHDELPNREDLPDHEVAKRLFDTYPRIYPFEDNEIILCVKIEPKDIGLLPKELWALSNNSFLMHGFYCYHHLIFAKMKDRYGCRYILGIPGIYHSRERFMARMFGFESFKSIRKRELQQGDFGYWYLDVKF